MATGKIDEEKFSVFKETIKDVIFSYGPNFAMETVIDATEQLLLEHYDKGYEEGYIK